MAERVPESEGANIVLIGDFNPKIFQPAWFAAQQLIRNEEAEDAKIDIIHSAVVSFSLEWLRLEVHQNRFFAATHQKPFYSPLRDLVVGTFRILTHTPVRMLGINCDFHFPTDSEQTWHAVGHRLAPKEMWCGVLEKPGLKSLSMEGHRPDEFIGRITVKVEPSQRTEYGVYVNINDHYEIKDKETSMGCEELIDILESSWDKSIARSEKTAKRVLEEK